MYVLGQNASGLAIKYHVSRSSKTLCAKGHVLY